MGPSGECVRRSTLLAVLLAAVAVLWLVTPLGAAIAGAEATEDRTDDVDLGPAQTAAEKTSASSVSVQWEQDETGALEATEQERFLYRAPHAPEDDKTGSSTTDNGLTGTATSEEMAGNGTEDDPYLITNVSELQAIEDDLGAHYELASDINASETAEWNDGAGFEPIGEWDASPFEGHLEGNGYTITDLTVDRPDNEDTGLFAYVDEGGSIGNLSLDNVSITGDNFTGGVVGVLFEGSVKNVTVSGTVSGQSSVGGIAGEGGNVDRSQTNVTISSEALDFAQAGGLVGAQTHGTISQSHTSGEIEAVGNWTGGAVGIVSSPYADLGDPRIANSSASVEVDGVYRVGGFVGGVLAEEWDVGIQNVYSDGTVLGDQAVGGSVGYLDEMGFAQSSVIDAFATGQVSGSDESTTGGVVGRYEDGQVTDTYWDINSTGQNEGIGNDADDGTSGLTTEELTGLDAAGNVSFVPDGPWNTTDSYPIQDWEIESMNLSLGSEELSIDELTDAIPHFSLVGARSVTAVEPADHSSANRSIASIADQFEGTVQAESPGTTTITASHAGKEDSKTVTVLEPAHVAVNVTDTNDPVVGGETLRVNVTAGNEGDEETTQDVQLFDFDGDVVDAETVTLDGGETNDSIQLTWETSEADAGTDEINVTSDDDHDRQAITVQQPAHFTIEIASTNDPVLEGEHLNVTANVTNAGDAADTQEVTLNIDGEGEVDNRTVSLDGGESTNVTLTWSTESDDAGEHEATVASENDTDTTNVTIEEEAAAPPPPPPEDEGVLVEITDVTDPVAVGETVLVTASVTNEAEENRTETIRLSVAGATVDETTVTLGPGESTTVDLAWDTGDADPDDYELSVASEDDEDQATVTVAEPPPFAVSIEAIPDAVTAGDPVALTLAVENLGDLDGTADVTVSLDGEERASASVTVPAGEGESVTVEVPTDQGDVGEAQLTAATADDDAGASVEVLAPDDTDDEGDVPPVVEDPEDEGTDDVADGVPVEENVTGTADQLEPVDLTDTREFVLDGIEYDPSPEERHVGTFAWLAAVLFALAGIVFLRAPTLAGRLFAGALSLAGLRATVDVLHVLVEPLGSVIEWMALLNVGLELGVAATFLLAAAHYGNEPRLTGRRGVLGLAGVAGLAALALLTDPVHSLVFADVSTVEEPFAHIVTIPGPAGWAILALNATLLVVAVGLILQSFLQHEDPAWRPLAICGAGVALAVLIAAMSVLEQGPLPQYDYNAAAVGGLLVLTTIPLLAHGLRAVTTVATESLVEELEDPIVILDDERIVIEWNGAAERLLTDLEEGRSFGSLLAEPIEYPAPGETTVEERPVETIVGDAVGRDSVDRDDGPVAPFGDGRSRRADGGEVTDADRESGVAEESRGSSVHRDGPGTASPAPDGRPERTGESGSPDDGVASVSHGADGDPGIGEHYLVQVAPVTTHAREGIGYIVHFADVTELRRQTDALREKNEKLDQFATTVSHDLRNPMNVLEGYLDLLADDVTGLEAPTGDADPDTVEAALRGFESSIDEMRATVDDLMTLARETGPVERFRERPFGELVADAWATVDTGEATLDVERDGTIRCDPQRTQRLLETLIRNAVEHGGPGAAIEIALTEDGFVVTDDGPGVDPERAEEIFEHGFSTTGSTGIGLTIVTELAGAHGWDVSVDSGHDGGRFVVRGAETTLQRRGDG